MKKRKIFIVIIVTLAMCLSLSVSVFANSSYGSNAEYYSPIFSVGGITTYSYGANYEKYNYGSILTPPTNVMLNNSITNTPNDDYYLTNTIQWNGLNANQGELNNTHSVNATTRFYNAIATNGELKARAETVYEYMRGNINISAFVYDVTVSEEYFINATPQNGYNVLDGFALWYPVEADVANETITVNWNQYEFVNDEIRLIPISVDIYLSDYAFYADTINGRAVKKCFIPFIDKQNVAINEAVERQVEAVNENSERLYYFNDITIDTNLNNLSQIAIYNTYDKTESLKEATGGYLRSTALELNVIDFENISWTSWLTNSVSSILEFELIPGISISTIFMGVLAIIALKAILNAFAGG